MARFPRQLRRLGTGLLLAAAALVGLGAWLLRVEAVPAELPPVEADTGSLVIPGLGDAPPLALQELRGVTSFFVVVGPQSRDSDEGELLHRALNRWEFPASTRGYIIGDAQGFGLLRAQVSKTVEHFAKEMRYPLYVDFDGAFIAGFGLSKGHHGFVVLGPDGEVQIRRSGGVEADELDQIRHVLGAREPETGPSAPAFELGPLDDARCRAEGPCAFIFLGREVARAEVPGIEDGFDGVGEQVAEQFQDPAIRMVSLALKLRLDRAQGVLVGSTRGLEFATWERVVEDDQARASFGIGPGQSALVIVADGRVAMDERDWVPLYKLGRVADLLGAELDRFGSGDDGPL